MIFFLIQERGGSNTEPPLKLKMSMPPFFDKKKTMALNIKAEPNPLFLNGNTAS
jgi:hypothetical protein